MGLRKPQRQQSWRRKKCVKQELGCQISTFRNIVLLFYASLKRCPIVGTQVVFQICYFIE
ncbi:hypothetical protein JHK86_022573 [Glycine max]|nr:hypothetical protein JHK86_022573 [Glycine max]